MKKKFVSITSRLKRSMLKFTILGGIVLIVAAGFVMKNTIILNTEEIVKQTALGIQSSLTALVEDEKVSAKIIAENELLTDEQYSILEKCEFLNKEKENLGYETIAYIQDGTAYTTKNVFDCGSEEYYMEAMKGNTYLKKVYGNTDEEMQIVITTPIYAYDGSIEAVLYLSKSTEDLINSVVASEINSENSLRMIIDQNGEVLLNSLGDETKNYIEAAKSNKDFEDIAQAHKGMIQSIETGEDGILEYRIGRKSYNVGYTSVEELGWIAIVGVPVQFTKPLFGLVACSILLLVVLIIVITRIGRKYSKDLIELREEVNVLESGKITRTKMPQGPENEISQIYAALDGTKEYIKKIVLSLQDSSTCLTIETTELMQVAERINGMSQIIYEALKNGSAATEDQSKNLTDISVVINGFGEKIKDNVDKVAAIHEKSSIINKRANASSEELNNTSIALKDLKDSFVEFTKKLEVMDQDISKMGELKTLISQDSAKEMQEVVEKVLTETKEIMSMGSQLNNQFIASEQNLTESVESTGEIICLVSEIAPLIEEINEEYVQLNIQKDSIIDNVSMATANSEELTSTTEEIFSSTEELVKNLKDINNVIEKVSSVVYNNKVLVNKFDVEE